MRCIPRRDGRANRNRREFARIVGVPMSTGPGRFPFPLATWRALAEATGWLAARVQESVITRPWALWFFSGLTVLGIVALQEVSALLGQVAAPGNISHDAGVFTGPRVNPFDTVDLRTTIHFWHDLAGPGSPAEASVSVDHIVRAHIIGDLFFIPAYTLLLACLLFRLNMPGRAWFFVPLAVFLADMAETLWTGVALWSLEPPANMERLIPWLSNLKFATLAVALFFMAWLLFRTVFGERRILPQRSLVTGAVSQSLDFPPVSLAWLFVLIALFAVFAAYPGSGTLNQIPDALRYQMIEAWHGDWWPLAFAVVLIALLPFVVAGGGWLATMRPGGPGSGAQDSPRVLAVAAMLSVALLAFQWLVDGGPNGLTWAAPLLVVAAIAVAGWLINLAGPELVFKRDTGGSIGERSENDALWAAGLAGAVAVVGGLGLVRAAVPELVLADDWDDAPWAAPAILGAVVAAFGGLVHQGLFLAWARRYQRVRSSFASRSTSARQFQVAGRSLTLPDPRSESEGRFFRLALAISVMIFLLAAILLALSPEEARRFGTTGTTALAVGAYCFLIGAVVQAGRRLPQWSATTRLGFGADIPLLSLVIATSFAASILNREGGYHDARTISDPANASPAHGSLESAIQQWVSAQSGQPGCEDGRDVLPMVFIAAPGGGAKAAFWTAASLDALFGDPCSARAVFAISGVSGGSVGATAWLAAGGQPSAGSAVRRMMADDALAADFAGLFFRDAPQPILGVRSGWRDRAALMEDRWIAANPSLGTSARPTAFGALTLGGSGWTPVVVLNASSVTDGCRILLANVDGLPASGGPNCYGSSAPGNAAGGGVSGSLDGLAGLYGRGGPASGACDEADAGRGTAGLSAVAAALLSARFPYISPSGALHRCVLAQGQDGNTIAVDDTTYAVDGGYLEGSGILTVLQLWIGVQRFVREHNARGETCIEPWLLVLSSGYQSVGIEPEAGRPFELFAPLAALGAGKSVLSEATLQQTAASVFDPASVPCGAGDAEAASTTRVIRLGLTRRLEVAAPLGWVLSQRSTDNMCRQLDRRIRDAYASEGILASLLRAVGHSEAPGVPCRAHE